MKYRYHAPQGVILLDSKSKPSNGRVDLYQGDKLKVEGCEIADREGGCTLLSGQIEEDPDEESGDGSDLTKDDIKALLRERGIEFDSRLGKDKLLELLESSDQP